LVHKNKNISFNRRSFLGTTAVSTAGMYLASQAPFSIAQDLRISEVGQTASTRHCRVRGVMRDGVQQFLGGAMWGSYRCEKTALCHPRHLRGGQALEMLFK